MIAFAWLLASSCAVVDEADRVTPEEVAVITQTYQRLAEDYEGEPLTVGRCDAACRLCVHLRLLGATTRIRLSGEHEGALATADLARPMTGDLAAFIRPVVWAVHTPAPTTARSAAVANDDGLVSAPVIILGAASVVAVGAGAAFGLSSAAARDELSESTGDSARTLELATRLDSHAAVANVLFATAAAAAGAAIAWLFIEAGK